MSCPEPSDSPLPPSDDRVAAEGGHQRGEGDGDEGGLAAGRLWDDKVELRERVQGSHSVESPAPTSRRPNRAVSGAHVDHGGPGIVEGHAVRGQSTPVVRQVVSAPGDQIRPHDLGAGRRARSRDVPRQSGVHGDRAAATGVDELQAQARDRDLVGEHVAELIQAYRRDGRSDADQRQRPRRLRWRDSDLGEVERLDGAWRRAWLRKQPHDTGDDPPHNKYAGRNRDPAVDRSQLHADRPAWSSAASVPRAATESALSANTSLSISKPPSRSRRSARLWRQRPCVSGATRYTSPNIILRIARSPLK